MDKVRYATTQPQTRPHTCHWPDCNEQVPPAMWGCKLHWRMLPHGLRKRLWQAYQPGQEINLNPSDEYLAAARVIDRWARKKIEITRKKA